MNQPQVVFSLRDITKMLGVSRTLIRAEIKRGKLRSFRKPNSFLRDAQHLINRTELVRYLTTWGIEPRHLRLMLNRPQDSNVILVRTRPSLQTAIMRSERAIRVDSLFALGDILNKWKVWAIAVDLGETGAAETTRSLSAYSRTADRPELIGLYDDEFAARSETAEVFDILLPLSRSDAAIAASIKELKP